MRVLVACEFSGIVRDAFRAKGHDAWSCDLLPCEGESRWHFQQNVTGLLRFGPGKWDLMIAHPPCQFLCNSSVRWLYKPDKQRDHWRWNQMEKAAEFFKMLYYARIPRICIENPVMHGYAQKIVGVKFTQSVQPWMFGHGEIKRTCLYLKNLPPLLPTRIVKGREARVHRASPGPDRWKERSRTLAGIAAAMAAQWGDLT